MKTMSNEKINLPIMLDDDHKGRMSRRDVLKVGAIGFLGLSLSLTDLFRMQAAWADTGASPQAKSVILLWMDGGPSQFDTFDPKLSAPAGIKSEFGAIKTKVPGLEVCELMPKMAQVMDKVTLV